MSAELAGGVEVVLWSGEEVDTGLPAGLMERDVGMANYVCTDQFCRGSRDPVEGF